MTIPDYIEVRTAAGALAAVLSPQADGLKDCYIDQRQNAECMLSLLLPLTSEKWAELTAECRIRANSKEFVILRPDAVDVSRDDQGKTWGKVTAAESWILLGKQYPTVSNDPETPSPADLQVVIVSGGAAAGGYPQGSAGSALTYLLQGSGWTLDTCDVSGTHDLETEKESLLANIQKVQEIWGGLLVWDSINKTVSLRDETLWQNYTGFQIRYAKNLKNITRTDNNDLVTRLYPFGQDDLDISSVNGGVKYLDNHAFSAEHYVGVYQNQDISDAQELKDKATEVLAKLCQPRFTYQVKLVDLRTLPEYSHEDFAVGDMTDIIDDDLGFDVQARIVRHKYNVFQPWQCELEIGEPEDRLVANLKDSFDVADYIRDALKPNPTTKNSLKGILDTLATTVQGASGDFTLVDGVSTWQERVGGVLTGKIVQVSPGGIIISSDGGENWTTAITGAGIASGALIGGTVIATAAIYLGDTTFALEAANRRVLVKDTQAVPVNRVILGKNGAGPQDYGLWVYDSSGNLVVGATGLGLSVVGTDQIANGAVTNLKVAGDLNAGKISTGTLNVGAGGVTVQTGPSGARVVLDSNGLKAYDSLGAATVEIKSDGSAIFKGSIESGSTITGTTITGGTIKTAASGQRVEIDSNGLIQYDSSVKRLAIETVIGGRISFYNGAELRGYISEDAGVMAVIPANASLVLGALGKYVYIRGDITVEYGSMSGAIDADTVDGEHASAFAASGHNHDSSYVKNADAQQYSLQVYNDGVNDWLEIYRNGSYVGHVQLS